MVSKSGPGKKSGSTRSGDAGDNDRIIGELKERVAVLENELRLKQSDTTPPEVIDREPMVEYLGLFQRMVDKAADMVFLLGPMGRILYVNDAACKVLGYTREELLSMTVFDINQKHHEDNWQEHEKDLKKQGSITFENVLVTKDNRLIHVENSANYARLGDKEYNYSFIRDITERKQIEEELRSSRDELEQRVQERTRELSKSEATLRQIIDTSPLPMVVYREEKNYYINNKFIETFGYTVADIPSIDEWWPLAYPNKAYCEFVKNRWYAAVDDAVKNKANITPQEVTVTCKDGSNRDVLAFFSSIGDMNLAILQDISERKRAEEAMRMADVRFRSLIQNSTDIIRILDREGRIIYESPSSEKILGYQPGYTLGKSPLEFIHPDDRERVRNDLDGVYCGRSPGTPTEFRIRKADGSYLDVESIGKNMIGIPGVDGIVITTRPITKRKQAEKALVRDRYILMKSQEVAHLGNWAWNLETGEFTASDENYRIYGYESGEVKPTREWVLSRVHPEDRKAMADFMEASSRDGRQGSIDFRVIRPDGSVVYLNTIVDKAVRDKAGKVTRLYGITQDITERKRAEQAVVAERQRLFSLLDELPGFVYLQDTDYRIHYANRRFMELFGDPKNVHCYEIFYGREEPCEVCPTLRALDTNTPFEWEWTSPAGRTYHLYDYPFREKDGPLMVLELGIDITGRKQAEEELKTAKQQAELYLDLMGHDINNMHQVALGYLELARGVTPGEGQAMLLDKPVEVLQRSAQLISNVRKLQKLHEGVFQTQDVDVSRVLEDVQREFGAIPNKRVMLNLNGQGPCLVRANELLHDVFANLLSNAIKHTGDQTNITVGLDTVKDNSALFCRVAVEDDGPGIPDGLKANIFNRMLKGTNKAKGMGLGLYLVKSLVDSYGGRVWVEDRIPGDHAQGARFVVMLPAIEK